jgi:transcriptional regulator with XRE-family HTH domain
MGANAMTQSEIGKRIAEERKTQGISIRELAERASTSTRAVQAVEKGWYNVGIDTYLKIAESLKLDLRITNTEEQ